MKYQHVVPILGSLLIVAISLQQVFLVTGPFSANPSDVFVGLDVAYDDLPAIRELIDEVKSYNNLFII